MEAAAEMRDMRVISGFAPWVFLNAEPVNGFFMRHHAKATSWPQYSRCREQTPVQALPARRGSARIYENLPKTAEISGRHFQQLRGRMVYMRTIAVFADIAE